MIIILLFISFFILCFIGLPVAISLGMSALITGLTVGITPLVMVQHMYAMLDSFTLLAIPLFLLVGIVMEYGEITDRLVGFSHTLVGHIRGGLGHVNVISNMIMAGISGSATADAAALGSLMIPTMAKEGYQPEMAAAINASAATMGPIIPPSMLMVVYGAYGGVSIASLFLAGAIPGILVAVSLMITIFYWSKSREIAVSERRATLKEIWESFKIASLTLVVPLIIILGVLGGKFTATESGMIATIYSLILTFFIYKTVKFHNIIEILKNSLVSMAHPMFCAAGAGAFGYMMAYLEIPRLVLELSGPIGGNYYLTLLFIAFLFIVLGTFMDAIPAIIIFLPIVQALSAEAGLDSLHVGILVIVVLCFGFVTPPYGLTLLISASIANINSTAVIKQMIPFYITFLLIVFIIIFMPNFVLFLPKLLLNS